MTPDMVHRSAVELAGLIRARTISPVELVQAYLARIDRWNEALGAYVTVCRERALDEARAAEQALGHGAPLGPLHGVPFAVKDQFDTAGVRTTSGSGIAAAAALAAATLGEDTGGSVRTPAAWCGAVGLRPTWGLVPRSGCVPVAWSMDAPGPLTRSVEDAGLLLSIIAGPDGHDRWMRPAPGDPRADLERGARGLSIGVVTTLVDSPETDAEVREAVRRSADTLRGLGARVEDVDLPLVPMAGAVFMALADGEAAAWHHRTLATRGDEYDAGTRRRLVTAALLPATLGQQAARARAAIRTQLWDALGRFDVLLAPTAPTAAPPIASAQAPIASRAEAGRRFFNRRSYTTPASLAGVPALSLPCGFTAGGLPIGLQLIGRRFDEVTLLRAGRAYERETDWHTRRPPLPA